VLRDGRPLTFEDRRRFGYMPEERGLYQKMKVTEQIEYFGRLRGMGSGDARRATEDLLMRLSLTERRNDAVDTLSLGNQQRVQLAVALVHDPQVLILDEPFSGLDPLAVDALADVLAERCRSGVPVLFSSHQLDLVERLCDRVGIVERGRLVAAGTVDELRADAREELTVRAPAAPPGWADGIAGVTVLDRSPGCTRLSLAPGADDQAVLRAALATGPVREFARSRPSLADLFRHLVREDPR
jgi:ABC-2 type transport system ATP-binding protein